MRFPAATGKSTGMNSQLVLLALVVSLLGGCATANQSIILCRRAEVQNGTWAKPQTQFTVADAPTLRLFGYGGHQLRFAVIDLATGNTVRTIAGDFPKSEMRREENAGMKMVDVGNGAIATSYDRVSLNPRVVILPLKITTPGNYEIQTFVDEQLTKSERFEIQP
ncbi:MAG: hypothetical protein RLZZ350_2631 [Verrucomicrobiota bacterium]